MFKHLAITLSIICITFCSYGQAVDTSAAKQVPRTNVLLNGIKFDTLQLKDMHLLFDAFNELTFKKVDIYFSGTGFPNVVVVGTNGKLRPGNFSDTFLDRISTGTKITFERGVLITNEGKVIAPYNKSIYFR